MEKDLIKLRQFKDICEQIGFVTENGNPDYARCLNLMAVGLKHCMDDALRLNCQMAAEMERKDLDYITGALLHMGYYKN